MSFVDGPKFVYSNTILGIFYERNRIDYLREIFLRAYARACAGYAAVRQTLGEPDPLRLKYRVPLVEQVAGLVRNCKDPAGAARWIAEQAAMRIDPRTAPASSKPLRPT